MDSSKSRLTYLLRRYHNKTATEHEEKKLFQLLNQATGDELAILLHKEWEKSALQSPFFEQDKSIEMLDQILQTRIPKKHITNISRKKTHVLIPMLAIAASILIFLSIATYFAIKPAPGVKHIATNQVLNDALPGGNKATLTLSNGKKIVLDNEHNGILAKQGNIMVNKTNDGHLTYRAEEAAADQNIAFNTLSTPRGGQYQVMLPDGSKIWLNATSSLKFPVLFKGKERMVELTGEAYFEVAKDKKHPFIVKTLHQQVEVLGTHFNINSYADEETTKTTLLEGSVCVSTNQKVKNKTNKQFLTPGQQAIVHSGDISVIPVETEVETGWKNGLFIFTGQDFKTVMRTIARWYDVDLVYDYNPVNLHIGGEVSRFRNVSEVLKMLEVTGDVKFKVTGKKITVLK